ncbi:MAG: TPM domain-containing protein [Opitutaceae bacterium]
MSIFTSLPKIDQDRVVAAIVAAELQTSGEIRVVLARSKATDPVIAAQRHFELLGMAHTTQRNGVLIFLAPRSRNFAVIGDKAVHEKCGDAFWRLLTAAMALHFKRGEFTEGLIHGIEKAGALLAEQFPRGPDDKDELPNSIVQTD